MIYKLFFIVATLTTAYLSSTDVTEIPILHKGRFVPLEVYSKLFLYDFYHAQEIDAKDLASFNLDTSDPLNFLIQLHFFGFMKFKDAALFYISDPQLRKELGVSTSQRLSLEELNALPLNSSNKSVQDLLRKKKVFESFKGYTNAIPPRLNPNESLNLQLNEMSDDLKVIPSRLRPTDWFGIDTLRINEAGSAMAFSSSWPALQAAYIEWLKKPSSYASFAKAYFEAYIPLAGKAFALSPQAEIKYPSIGQLHAENFYYAVPLISMAIILYLTALSLLLLYQGFPKKIALVPAVLSFSAAFLLHTFTLFLRAYILNRPPVANMAETVIYVPWIATCVGIGLSIRFKSLIPAAVAAGLSAVLLSILEWTFPMQSLENVQAVLNSQFWLSVHVLMIVASYGVLIFAGLLGHIYLTLKVFFNRDSGLLSKCLLQSLYIGVALLIPGTILGGVWAAQSWGRFWDWDPKESWAFITACFYLLVIHAERFHFIGRLGVALGAVLGVIAVSFTWYGVNYILGTGLHTYGFGNGGEWIYYTFIGAELLFLLSCLATHFIHHQQLNTND